MSRSLNKLFLIGNVGADPEVRSTTGGRRVANFSLATSRQWDNDAGQKQERTEWHRCQVWGPLADVVERYVRKGDKLYLEGRVEYRTWTDRDEQERFSTDVVVQELTMLGSAKGNGSRGSVTPRPKSRSRDDDNGGEPEYEEEEGDGDNGGEYEEPEEGARPRSGKRSDTQNRPERRPASQRRSTAKRGR